MPNVSSGFDLESGLGWALLSRGRAAQALRTLLLAQGDPEAVLRLRPTEAAALARESEDVVAPLLSPKSVAGVAEQRRRLEACGARVVLLTDTEYPALLREIADPPPVLFVRGGVPGPLPAVAIVGARRATRWGLEAARRLAGGLSRAGVAVISGFARGIDAAAHEATLAAEGKTVAVLGCGVDVCYPPEQGKLFARVVELGAVISEFPLGTRPQAFLFPVRNRLIAGLARMVVVVEAATRSGALITARLAAEYGRDVGAVPGPVVSPLAEGTNALLKDGAILVRDAADVLAELPDVLRTVPVASPAGEGVPVGLGPDATRLYLGLDPDEARDADELVRATGLSAARLSAALVELELEGLALALPGAVFLRRREKT